MTEPISIYRWAKERGITTQVAYSWRRTGLPTDSNGRVVPADADAWLAKRQGGAQPRSRGVVSRDLPTLSSEAFVDLLRHQEPESIVRGLASLTFLRSQGRTLAGGSQIIFMDFAWLVLVPSLHTIETREEFDHAHTEWVKTLLSELATNRAEPLTYGQGQKSLNVFLKFYVDWSSLPDNQTASRLRPWLHCPLDKVVMDGLARTFRDEYRTRVRPESESSGGQRFSLSRMTEASYWAWQRWIRELSPAKPVLVDVSWALERAVSGES